MSAQHLLPPAEHSFWRQPDAAQQALRAVREVERDRVAALSGLEAALERVTELSQSLFRAEQEARQLREALHRERGRAGDAEAALARERATRGPWASPASASPSKPSGFTLVSPPPRLLSEQQAQPSPGAQASPQTAGALARENQRLQAALNALQLRARPPPAVSAPELVAANSAAATAMAEAASLRASLQIERTRCRDAARAAEGALAEAASLRSALASAARASPPLGAPSRAEVDALRCELLEERIRSRGLAEALMSSPRARETHTGLVFATLNGSSSSTQQVP